MPYRAPSSSMADLATLADLPGRIAALKTTAEGQQEERGG